VSPPFFSLVIPTKNRAEILVQALSHLENLTYSRARFEIIVVNDGSTDQTEDCLAKLEVDFRMRGLNIRVFHRSGSGTSATRNFAIEQAKGSHILFVDDDVFPCTDLLEHHEEAHRGHLRRLVRGPVINIPSLPLPSGRPRLIYHYSQNYLCTSNASIRRSLLLEAGLFDEGFVRWEDAELGVRLKKLGVSRHFVLGGYVHHLKPPISVERQLEYARNDGQSAALLFQRYPSLRMRLRSGLHPLNYFRSGVLTAPPLRKAFENYLSRQPDGKWAGLATSLLAEREYLRSGREQLKSEQDTKRSES
jgi:glycosyltransferase involved in cell wall biosynthesis